jgi:hypothetical protein
MSRLLSLLVVVSISIVTFAQAPAPKFDPERAFQKGDTNGDKKLTLKEFTELTKNLPRFKDNPALVKVLFDRLDADNNGSLSLEEFKKIGEMRKNDPAPAPKKNPPTPAPKEKAPSADQLAFFEKKIRPVLIANCYECHSQQSGKSKGGLLLDTRDSIRKGGESGPAVVPGSIKDSLLIKAIRHSDKNLQMPKEKLADDVIGDFEKWVSTGAADPRDPAVKIARQELDIEKGRQFWAFQPVKMPQTPKVNNASWPRNDLDRHLLAALEAKNLKPVGDADAYTLIRRVYFDLIGLPPSPEVVQKFAKDYAAQPAVALEKVVDQLLASPQFGERWGRHWLDVARFAESTGRSVNFNFPHAWRYRDYVIDAVNADKPYDQFILEQLAGDLLPAQTELEKAQHQIATGFLAIGPKSINERMALQFQMDLVDEQIDATFQAFQALTVACARCHDHKFDPIPTKDYYALAGIFRSTETCYGTPRIIQSNHPAPLIQVPNKLGLPARDDKLSDEQRQRLVKQIDDLKKQVQERIKAEGQAGRFNITNILANSRVALVENKLESFEADGTPKTFIMGTRERSRTSDCPIYTRGEIEHPAEIVPRGSVQVVSRQQPNITRGSGRLELARWIASKDNPLTARVMVNRIWLHLFGQGLVPTPDNFGASGRTPTNPQLLDYLAMNFMDHGWSVKNLIKVIVLSRAYQLDSKFDPQNAEIDPDNSLTWRMSKLRLEAEAIRDGMLCISEGLDRTPPKTSAVAKAGEGPTQFAVRFNMRDFDGSRSTHRSVYMPILRDQVPEVLSLFDFPDASLPSGERSVTTVPSQSLYLMNNPFVIQQAQTAADLILRSGSDEGYRIEQAYLRFYSRPPTEKETKAAKEFLTKYVEVGKKRSPEQQARSAWAALCQALFASADFLYRN